MAKIQFKDLHTLLTVKVLKNINFSLILYDNNAPQPSDVYSSDAYNILTWRLSGSFNTLNNKEYYNDTKEKLLLILNAYDATAEHLLKGITSNKNCFVAIHNKYSKHQAIYTLKDFKHIEDLRVGRTKVMFNKHTKMSIFKKISIIGYNLAGEGNLTIEKLDEAIHKHSNDYRADAYMAKDIYHWIVHKMETGQWYAQKKIRKITISRTENALLQSKKIFESNYKIFNDYFNFIGDTDINVANIAKILKLSRPTIYKFIEKYKNLKSVKSILHIGGVAKRTLLDPLFQRFNYISLSPQNRFIENTNYIIDYNCDIILNKKVLKELYYGYG